MSIHEGGCICGAVRYRTLDVPLRVTVCHCRFCQRATGSAYMVEPIFQKPAFEMLQGEPATYAHRSTGSAKIVNVHFCRDCGTKLWLTFERFEDAIGIYAGTFDDPCWFDIRAEKAKHIFLDAARGDSIIPAGLPAFRQHAMLNDGTPCEPAIYSSPHVMSTENEGSGRTA